MSNYGIGIILTLLVVLPACNTVNMSERENAQGLKESVQDRRVITDLGLNAAARIVGVNEGRTPGGLLHIQVELLNTTPQVQNVCYKYEWLDSTGMLVTPVIDGWTDIQILGRESRLISGIAPQPEVVDFRFKVLKR